MAGLNPQVQQRWRLAYEWLLESDAGVKRKCVAITMTGKENKQQLDQLSLGKLTYRTKLKNPSPFFRLYLQFVLYCEGYRVCHWFDGVLVIWGCHNKIPQTGWFKQQKFLRVWRVRIPRSKCQCFPSLVRSLSSWLADNHFFGIFLHGAYTHTHTHTDTHRHTQTHTHTKRKRSVVSSYQGIDLIMKVLLS